MKLGALDYEVFGLVLADQRHKVIECVELFRGTIDGASVYPREIVKLVLERQAASVVLFHNHPSMVCDVSHADELIADRLRDCLALIDVNVKDHLIIGGGNVLSFAKGTSLIGAEPLRNELRQARPRDNASNSIRHFGAQSIGDGVPERGRLPNLVFPSRRIHR